VFLQIVDVLFFEFRAPVRRQFSREAQVDPSVVEGGELLVGSHFIKLHRQSNEDVEAP
jgi:hypothetical protein